MVFNSLTFVAFFIIVFALYWWAGKKSLRSQNYLLLLSSYAFYAYWDWRFASLLIFSSLYSFIIGRRLCQTKSAVAKQWLLILGILLSIGTIAYFKYFNFFVNTFIDCLKLFHITAGISSLQIILPLGISFFTFRNLAYLLDINKGKIKPVTDWLTYFNFVAFFPCLVSGPIDRAGLLVPQLEKEREFNNTDAADGLRQILWGLFKKVVIADNCALVTQYVFANYQTLPASSIWLGLFYYTIQIYADFSGYSDMAIGVARLLGFNITRNFDFPFFSQNISEFWRKWHMSLTSFLTEYVFTPLNIAFRDYGKAGIILAILINFLIIGIWHGPNWTFVVFGALHGCYYITLILRGTNVNKKLKSEKHNLTTIGKMLSTFMSVMLAFVVFKSDSINQAIGIYTNLFKPSILNAPVFEQNNMAFYTFILIVFLIGVEWLGKHGQHALSNINVKFPIVARWGFYYFLIAAIFLFSAVKQQFIYFRF